MPKLSRNRKSAAASSQDVKLQAKKVWARQTQLIRRNILTSDGILIKGKQLRLQPKLFLEYPALLEYVERLLRELERIKRFKVGPALLTPAKQRQLLQGKFVKVTDGHKTRCERPLAPSQQPLDKKLIGRVKAQVKLAEGETVGGVVDDGPKLEAMTPEQLEEWAKTLEDKKKCRGGTGPRTEDQQNHARAIQPLGAAAKAAKARTGRWANLLQCLHKDCKKGIDVAVTVHRPDPDGTGVYFTYRCPHCGKHGVGQKRHTALYDLLKAWADNVTNWTEKQSVETMLVLTLHE